MLRELSHLPPPGYVKTQTTGNLFVGSLRDALDERFLAANNISLVITTIYPYGEWPEHQRLLYGRMGLAHVNHALFDVPHQTLDFERLNLPDVHEYLTQGYNVLVHCEKGISRSVTLCLAYLIVYEGYNAHEALAVVRQCRHIAYPNRGFWHQLNMLCELYSFNKPLKVRSSSEGNSSDAAPGSNSRQVITAQLQTHRGITGAVGIGMGNNPEATCTVTCTVSARR